MSTRRFYDDTPDRPTRGPSDYEVLGDDWADQPSSAGGRSRTAVRGGAHLPRSLAQVLNEANDMVVRGDLTEYVPLTTGFDPLDGMIGGGLRKTELVLLGGAQGIGKTSATL